LYGVQEGTLLTGLMPVQSYIKFDPNRLPISTEVTLVATGKILGLPLQILENGEPDPTSILYMAIQDVLAGKTDDEMRRVSFETGSDKIVGQFQFTEEKRAIIFRSLIKASVWSVE